MVYFLKFWFRVERLLRKTNMQANRWRDIIPFEKIKWFLKKKRLCVMIAMRKVFLLDVTQKFLRSESV